MFTLTTGDWWLLPSSLLRFAAGCGTDDDLYFWVIPYCGLRLRVVCSAYFAGEGFPGILYVEVMCFECPCSWEKYSGSVSYLSGVRVFSLAVAASGSLSGFTMLLLLLMGCSYLRDSSVSMSEWTFARVAFFSLFAASGVLQELPVLESPLNDLQGWAFLVLRLPLSSLLAMIHGDV